MKKSHLNYGSVPPDWSLQVALSLSWLWSGVGGESVSVLCGGPRSSEVEDTALY